MQCSITALLQYDCKYGGQAMTGTAPTLDGIHHVKLPVADLERSIAWYAEHLGYDVQTRFIEQEVLMGVSLSHPNGGPVLALRLDPDLAARAAGFDYFSLGVPTRAELEDLADRLTAAGVDHAGVHYATIGWILPGAVDPDGHAVRFYTTEAHTPPPAEIRDPRESAERHEAQMRSAQHG
jgi:catechol 2,3-dioxygenase-like lactoylglutathione lyase family enzyme